MSPRIAHRATALAVASSLLALLLAPAAKAGPSVTVFPAGSVPHSIAAGPDGKLWFTDENGNSVDRITTAGKVKKYALPTAKSAPWGIADGPDSNLWFTEFNRGVIGRITPKGVLTEFTGPTFNAYADIAAGPDGNLWFTEFAPTGKIGRLTTSGSFTEFTIPTFPAWPIGIAAGPDGNLWFTEGQGNQIGRITTSGVITEFSVPTAAAWPSYITAGPDGNLWFTEAAGNNIGRITTSGTITEFPIPTGGSVPEGIAAGMDGTLWFMENNVRQIGQITTSGTITESSASPALSPFDITTGPDGNLWFTDNSSQIGTVAVAPSNMAFSLVRDTSFTPTIAAVSQGELAFWMFEGPNAHDITDASGLNLFGSGGPKAPVGYSGFVFSWAGSFPYKSAVDGSALTGKVSVPIVANPTSGGVLDVFNIQWATAPPPPSYVLDVQISRPGVGFKDWRPGTTMQADVFTPDAGPGTYRFRARIRRPDGGAVSGWSKPVTIAVS